MSNSRFQNAIRGVPQLTPPIWMMRQAGRYHRHYQELRSRHDFVTLCKNPNLAAEVALGPVEDFDFDVAILFSDLLFPLEALGLGLSYDPSPRLHRRLTDETLKDLSSHSAALEQLEFQREAVAKTRERLPVDKSLIGFVGGPWTLFTYAVEGGHSGSLASAKNQPQLLRNFADRLVPLLIDNIRLQLEGGAEVVMIFDTAAGELSPGIFRDQVSLYLKKMASAFPGRIGYYSKGTQEDHLRELRSSRDFAGFGFDHRWEMSRVFGGHKGFFQGNFDQALLFTPENQFVEVLDRYLAPILKLTPEQRSGWICGLGHGVLPRDARGECATICSTSARGVSMIKKELLKKYDTPVPRYTSYPTVPYWTDAPTTSEWTESLRRTAQSDDMTWAIYLHIPFCETLCTYCGCNTSITKNHDKESPYVENLLKELSLYRETVPELFQRPLRQIHLGGGTPTFLSGAQLGRLIDGIDQWTARDPNQFEGSIEVDPRRTTADHLQALFDRGFRRVSMGVQDFNKEVQVLVNRVQPFEITRDLTDASRKMGYDSVNFDLIYGLPKQTPERMEKSVDQTIELRPDRIALYSFAKVPWIKPAQRLFKDEDLPEGAEKRALFELSYDKLIAAGYVEIGMDHFALPTDALALAQREKRMHRNFMGYTDVRTSVLLGVGVSSISETPDCFHQNEKVLPIYERKIVAGEIPTLRGHKLTRQDQVRREQILRFMANGEVDLESGEQAEDVRDFLKPLVEDGLVKIEGLKLKLSSEGRPFLRNACVALDQRLRTSQPLTRIFSQSL